MCVCVCVCLCKPRFLAQDQLSINSGGLQRGVLGFTKLAELCSLHQEKNIFIYRCDTSVNENICLFDFLKAQTLLATCPAILGRKRAICHAAACKR